jgi:dipeptidyl aminopeptidase/acylaminoacyl peptidase
MKRDLRSHPLYLELAEDIRRANEPGLGRLVEASDVHASTDGAFVAVAGPVLEELSGMPFSRIGVLDVGAGSLYMLGNVNEDSHPRWSPNGHKLAFLSDRAQRGDFKLYIIDRPGEAAVAHAVELTDPIESLAWSPDGTSLLLQTAGAGADRAGAQGSGTLLAQHDGPEWLPDVEEAVPPAMWRRLWLYRVAERSLRRLGPEDQTFWEIAWCGNDEVIGVVSSDPRESGWYHATLVALAIADDTISTLYRPQYEIGLPAGSPDGSYAAIVEASCSDRTIVAGDVLVFDRRAGSSPKRVDTKNVDVTCLGFRSAERLYFCGIRNLDVVAGEIQVPTLESSQHWEYFGAALSRYPGIAPLGANEFVTVAHAYDRAPAIVRIADGNEHVLLEFGHEGSKYIASVAGDAEALSWKGRDGLAIYGLLTHPKGPGPYPLVVMVHGGPTGCFLNTWQMRRIAPLLAQRGYAVLHPNPRGSSGRGQAFARMVRGDMNGEDAFDIIAGVEALVEKGTIDRDRVAVTGVSYGGMMTSWLVTQTDLFAAAISISPVTDNISQHFTSNIPEFDRLFFSSEPSDVHGKHFSRSPVFFAQSVRTPTLNIAGAKDRCTPPTQAVEFHRALIEHGVVSELVIYPLEGHGVRGYEAFIDYCTRMLIWLERYVASRNAQAAGSR